MHASYGMPSLKDDLVDLLIGEIDDGFQRSLRSPGVPLQNLTDHAVALVRGHCHLSVVLCGVPDSSTA